MKESKNYIFTRVFLLPIVLTVNDVIFLGYKGFKSLLISFCIYFTLNWFFDKTIVEWSARRSEKIKEKKKQKETN